MTISALPAAPSRSDAPDVFIAKADAFVAALATLVTEMNAALGVVNITEWVSGTTYAVGEVTWSPADFQGYRRKTAGAGTTDPSADSTNWQRTEISATSLQTQSATAFTTAGTAPAFTLTPSPAPTAYTSNLRFRVKFNAAGTTGSNTLNISGLGVKNLKQFDSAGAKVAAVVAANQLADVEYDGTDLVILDPLPPTVTSKLQPITASVAANALTLTLNPTALDFRADTLSSGAVNTRSVSAAISMVVSSGSSLGTVNATAARLAVLAIDNAGTVELAVVNMAGGTNLDETALISTTAEGGAGAADSASTIYSTTARANVPFRVVGFVDVTEATAGTWATAPSTIQGAGGQALAMAGLGYGQTWQAVTRNSGTTYYNTTGKPIVLHREFYGSGASVKSDVSINGGAVITFLYCVIPSGFAGAVGSIVIPPGASYVVTDTGGVSAVSSRELR
ncbi:MAG: hypothetical protein HYY97_15810 [Rhodocyclales bacterium]|nr:hypothetical protein [Rhodocyclales bacterium]